MPLLYVVPAAGRRVRYFDAAGQPRVLPDEGLSVAWSGFWQRRLDEGDVVIGAPPTGAPQRARAPRAEE